MNQDDSKETESKLFQTAPDSAPVACPFNLFRKLRSKGRPSMPWVAILGMDGSGKSTVIEGIREEWGEMGLETVFPHWRPEYIKPGKAEGPVTNPHGHPPRGLVASILKLVFLLADWTIGFRFILGSKRRRGCLVIFDRCYHDLLVDPIRYRYGAPLSLARFAFRFFPKPDAIILLDAPAELLHARKPETTLEMARKLRVKYRNLVSEHPDGIIIDCSKPAQEVIKDTSDILKRMTRECRAGSPENGTLP